MCGSSVVVRLVIQQ